MSEDSGIDRRRLVRILIILGIGLPIMIELFTFSGLVSHSLLGDGTETETPTPMADAVGVGDELLAETPSEERITTASVGQTGTGWQFVLTVQVTNEAAAPYELRLGTVHTTAGTDVEGAATTDRIEPGETDTVTGSWTLPEGERPRSLDVTALTYGTEGPTRTNATVQLKPVPIQGG